MTAAPRPASRASNPAGAGASTKTVTSRAAIAIRRQAKAARRTPEQEAELAAILAKLPRLTREEVEAGRSLVGGFTREQLACGAILRFRDAAGNKWIRRPDGGLVEQD